MINVRNLMKEIYDEREHPHKIIKYLQSNNHVTKSLEKPMYEMAEQKISYSNLKNQLELKQKFIGKLLKNNFSNYFNEDNQANQNELNDLVEILQQEIISSPIGDKDFISFENLNKQKEVYHDLIEFSNAIIKYKKYQKKTELKEIVNQIKHDKIKYNQLSQQPQTDKKQLKKKLRSTNSVTYRFLQGVRKQQKIEKEEEEITQLKQLIKNKYEIRERDKVENLKKKNLIQIIQQLTKKLILNENLDQLNHDDNNNKNSSENSCDSMQIKDQQSQIKEDSHIKLDQYDLEEGLANINQLNIISEQFKLKKIANKHKLEILSSDSLNGTLRNSSIKIEQFNNEYQQNQQPEIQQQQQKSKFQIQTFLKPQNEKKFKNNKILNQQEQENLKIIKQQTDQGKTDIEKDLQNAIIKIKKYSNNDNINPLNQEIIKKEKEQFQFFDQKEDIFEKLQKKRKEQKELEEKQKKAEKFKRINKIRSKLGLVKSGETKSFLKNQLLLNSLDEKQRLADENPQKRLIALHNANPNNQNQNAINKQNTQTTSVKETNYNNQNNQNINNKINSSRNIIGLNIGDNSQNVQTNQKKLRQRTRPNLSPRNLSKLHYYHDNENIKTINFLSPQNQSLSNLNNFTNSLTYNTGQQTPLLTSRSVQRNIQLNSNNQQLANSEQKLQINQMKNFNFFSKVRKSAYFQDQIANQSQQELLQPPQSSVQQVLRSKLYSQQQQSRQMKNKVKNFFENIQNYEEAFCNENQQFYQNIDHCFTDIDNQLVDFQNTLESGNAKIECQIVDNLKQDIILYSNKNFLQNK